MTGYDKLPSSEPALSLSCVCETCRVCSGKSCWHSESACTSTERLKYNIYSLRDSFLKNTFSMFLYSDNSQTISGINNLEANDGL